MLESPGYGELALSHCTGDAEYFSIHTMYGSKRHDGHRRTAL
ncbi:hypothetical protein ES702_02386 [subsurface metagenome]